MSTIQKVRAAALDRLKAATIPNGDPDITADALLTEALGCERSYLRAHPESPIPCDKEDKIMAWVAERVAGRPLHRIIGRREFYSHQFHVAPGVFLPRPETETLVEAALDHLKDIQRPLVCDVGCGSGVIGLTLALECPAARVMLFDKYRPSLDLTLHNATRLGLLSRVTVLESDLLSAFKEGLFDREYRIRKGPIEEISLSLAPAAFDAIVSNPPYVESGVIATLDAEVKDYDPHEALDGGPDGCDVIRRLLEDVGPHPFLKPGGLLAVELSPGQPEILTAWLDDNWAIASHWVRPGTVIKDLWGRDRVMLWKKRV